MRIRHLAALSIALAFAVPANGNAQIGGLVKKGKDAATKKADSTARPASTSSNIKPSNAFGPELTSSSLGAVLRGASAGEAKLEQADRLRAQQQDVYKKADAVSRGHDKDRQAYQALVQKNSQCWHTEWDKVQAGNRTKAQAKVMSDPNYIANMQKAGIEQAQKMRELQQKNDTAGMRKLAMETMNAQMKAAGVDPHADSETVRKTCGGSPTKPAFMAEEDADREQGRQLEERIRRLQDSSAIAGMSASGMNRQDYNLARERIVNWVHETKGGSQIQAFGSEERRLLESRKSEIMKLAKVFS